MNIRLIAAGSSRFERFIRRWGVSFLVGEDVLFDTFGDPVVFMSNMRRFRVDTAKLKHIILSHDDWDHIAGLWYVLSGRTDITVYICPGFREDLKDRIRAYGVNVVEAGGVTRITNDVYSTGQLCADSHGRKIYEQSVVIKAGAGLAVLCGCAHPGVVRIVRHVQEQFGEKVDCVIGGLHLKDNTDELNRCIVADLRGLGVRRIAPMHCTGAVAVRMIREEFGREFVRAAEGRNIVV